MKDVRGGRRLNRGSGCACQTWNVGDTSATTHLAVIKLKIRDTTGAIVIIPGRGIHFGTAFFKSWPFVKSIMESHYFNFFSAIDPTFFPFKISLHTNANFHFFPPWTGTIKWIKNKELAQFPGDEMFICSLRCVLAVWNRYERLFDLDIQPWQEGWRGSGGRLRGVTPSVRTHSSKSLSFLLHTCSCTHTHTGNIHVHI